MMDQTLRQRSQSLSLSNSSSSIPTPPPPHPLSSSVILPLQPSPQQQESASPSSMQFLTEKKREPKWVEKLKRLNLILQTMSNILIITVFSCMLVVIVERGSKINRTLDNVDAMTGALVVHKDRLSAVIDGFLSTVEPWLVPESSSSGDNSKTPLSTVAEMLPDQKQVQEFLIQLRDFNGSQLVLDWIDITKKIKELMQRLHDQGKFGIAVSF